MKTVLSTLLVALIVLAASGPPARAEDTKARQELQAIYDKLAEVIKNKEAGGAADLVTADYVERDVFGQTHTRQQVQERLRKSLAATESIDALHADVLRVVTKGDHALALTRRKAAATIDDKNKKPHKMALESMTLDLWDKAGDTWKLARTEQLSLRMTLDGKGMRPVRRKRPAKRTAAGPPAPVHPGALMLAAPIHPQKPVASAPRAQADVAAERVTKVAQFYTTPYNYGWGGNGYGYGYGYGPNAGYAMGIGAGTYQSRNNANITASVNAQNGPRQASIYQQQLAYERALKQQKQYKAYVKKMEAQMQARLQEEQAERAKQPESAQ